MKKDLLLDLREGRALSFKDQIALIVNLSIPAIMAMLSSVIMQYIDASMVGSLGAEESAAIGLVSSSTWLFGSACTSIVSGFTVLVAQSIGGGNNREARSIMKQAFAVSFAYSFIITAIGAAVSGVLPVWLGGDETIVGDAASYFLVYALSLPTMQLSMLSGGMLQSSGDMKTPSVLNILMCFLDVLFNWLFIYPTREVFGITVWGAGLGVTGAALGTTLARVVAAGIMTYVLLCRSEMLRLRKGEPFELQKPVIVNAVRISVPIFIERVVMSGAQVVTTRIVAPLGNVAIAANSFAVTAESLCYMPGEGVAMAATTIIGQSVGAKRKDVAGKLGWITTCFGMAVMTFSGILMFFLGEYMIGFLSPDPAVVALGTAVLRIEAFAEPMFAASMVVSGALRGAGDTLVPAIINFCSMWLVRVPLSALLAPSFGLHGVWFAMALELTVRGILFLIRLARKNWLKKAI